MKLAKFGPALALASLTASAGMFAGYSFASQPRMDEALRHLNAAEHALMWRSASSMRGWLAKL